MRKIILIFILVVVGAIGVAGFWYWQKNQYSKEILKLEILGPESIQAGDEVEYLIKFKNNGKVRLENPELIFEYPQLSIPLRGESRRITTSTEDIYPGEERVESFKARVFGKENETAEARAFLSYRPNNLTARYESETTQTSQIKFVPLTFEFDLPLKSESDEEIDFSLNYFSNIDFVLGELRVKLEYPEGFKFISASPRPLDETEWDLSELYQADGGRIDIKGVIEGDESSQKIFRAKLGLVRDNEFWLLKEAAQSIEITTPTLYISQLINGSQNYVAESGDLLHFEIFFKNIGRTPIQKKFLFSKLEGDFYDLDTLKSDKGEVGRGDNSIIWDWKVVSDLRFLDEGEEGKVDFWVNVEDSLEREIKNPTLKNRVTIGGTQRVFETKINSQVPFSQKVFFNQEFWSNSGPIPPEVGQKTTYTVVWQIGENWNDLRNLKVKTTLPENIKPTGQIFPEDAKFTYDSKSKEAIWNVGDVEAFSEESPLTLAFQIEFTPDSSQKGKTPDLVEEADVLAEDVFTGEIINVEAGPVNTTLPDDESISSAQGKVK